MDELASGGTMRLSRAHVVSAWPGCPSSCAWGARLAISPDVRRLLPSGRMLAAACEQAGTLVSVRQWGPRTVHVQELPHCM